MHTKSNSKRDLERKESTLLSEWNKQKRNITQKILKHKKFCGYNSEKFKPNELKWIISEKELYTIRLSLQKFKIFFAHEFFIIRIDNKTVRNFLVNTKKASGKRMQ